MNKKVKGSYRILVNKKDIPELRKDLILAKYGFYDKDGKWVRR